MVVIVALAGVLSVSVKPSSDSITVSPLTLTVTVWLLSPAAKLTAPTRQAAAKVIGVGGVSTAAGHCIGRIRDGREIAGAGHRKGERGRAAVALEFNSLQGGDGQLGQRQDIIVLDAAGRSGGAECGIGRSAERYREVFIQLDGGIAADIDGDGLARLAGGKVDRAH